MNENTENTVTRRDVLKRGAAGAGALAAGGLAAVGSATAEDCVLGFWVGEIPDQTFSLSRDQVSSFFQSCRPRGRPERRGIIYLKYSATSCDSDELGTFWARVTDEVPPEAQVETVHRDCEAGPDDAKQVTLCSASCSRVLEPRLPVVKPDLVPVPHPDTDRFCRRDEGDLIVVVKNRGMIPADTSITEVTFQVRDPETQEFVPESIRKETPALESGESESLRFDIPAGCFSPNCNFTITVDADDDVTELNEDNNQVEDSCIG